MQTETKVVITAAALVMLMFVMVAVGRGDRGGADADWGWRGGRSDLVRGLLLRPDGSFKRYAKHTVAILVAVAITLMWTLL